MRIRAISAAPGVKLLLCVLLAGGMMGLSAPIHAGHNRDSQQTDLTGRMGTSRMSPSVQDLSGLKFPGEPFTATVYLPLLVNYFVPPSGRLCRFGVGANRAIGAYAVNGLRIGWYVDWTATTDPARPGQTEYMPMVRLKQTGSDSYTYSPNGDTLLDDIMANPGATWLIGNEPDRRRWQDDMEPHLYARAYHELYNLIKGVDPEAQISAGGIVQATPLRLQYLDMVLDSYESSYGEAMPVDVWNIHIYILRERSCDYFPEDCWGAEIPPGIDAPEGMLYDIQDNDNLDIFKQQIEWFRQWMADNGYQDRPLILTEMGVLMWPEYGFPPERVNAFMDNAFDYLLTATGPLGYPADGYRMVQRWAWYSLADDSYNGWLFDPGSKQRTVFGDHFVDYTSSLSPMANVFPVRMWTDPETPISSGEPVTVTLYAQVANTGNVRTSAPVRVHFYDGDPDQGGVQIGSDQTSAPLDGCAGSATAQVTWSGVEPGEHTAYVVVDPENNLSESDESDNVASVGVSVVVSYPNLRRNVRIARTLMVGW
jgi:hypothetical protein